MRTTFIESLSQAASENPDIWLLCGDLGYSVLEPFAAKFPDRYLNVGVAEQNMAGIAAGIALSGKTVFIYSIGNFPTLRCLEQLRNDVCYHGADVKVVAVGAGYAYGSQGYTHHALEDAGIMSMLPGIEVFVPCDPNEVRAATRLIAGSGKPSYLRLSRQGEPNLGGDVTDIRKPRVLREGGEIAILASGPIASRALAAADELAERGRNVRVVSVSCLKPLDEDAIRGAAGNAALVVTLEEHILRGGLFSLVAGAFGGSAQRPRVAGIGIPEQGGRTSSAGSREALLDAAGLSVQAIVARIEQSLQTR
ncbi:transketolase family protein [Bradyrhizobium sp. GCM10027634]|uniref:transketolase family protein n=1 Tax=unclassified Bradyrhizobium TaxID=2631580 RepID=UPI00263ADF9E|nr:transketolase C-terminal domain-containing protein [Bradyrhizobium sp. WYCCWR 12677]MDN5006363.1 transketolase C-terminal domain-containing protein [Bradyrhizobium sp. WYCCWR 12677]